MPNTYATVDRLISLCGENQIRALLDTDASSDLSQNERLLACIARANDTVDSYIRGIHKLPLPGNPASADYYPVLTGNAVSIAKWYLLEGRPEIEGEIDRSRYKDSLQYLSDLALGKSRLDIMDEVESAAQPLFGKPAVVTITGKREPIVHEDWMFN